MNWYTKTSQSKDNSVILISCDITSAGNNLYHMNFTMRRNSRTFNLLTKNPIPKPYNIGEFFIKEENKYHITDKNIIKNLRDEQTKNQNLTTSKAMQEQEAVQNKNTPQLPQFESLNKIQEPPKSPTQPEWKGLTGFTSRRSELVNKKARTNKMQGGRGDDLEVKDVDKGELTIGVGIELEHMADNKNISKENIKEFVENLYNKTNKEIENKEILERSLDIAMDHLAEIPDYYTRLTKMEQEAKNE